MSTVGEQLVQVLRQAGVARVYGVVGDSLNPFVDAIRRTEGIEWIHVRNEEAGAFAAAAEAQLTGLGLRVDERRGGGLFDPLIPGSPKVCESRPEPGVQVLPGTTVELVVARACG